MVTTRNNTSYDVKAKHLERRGRIAGNFPGRKSRKKRVRSSLDSSSSNKADENAAEDSEESDNDDDSSISNSASVEAAAGTTLSHTEAITCLLFGPRATQPTKDTCSSITAATSGRKSVPC